MTGCSVGSVGSSGGDASGEATTISVLSSNTGTTPALMKAFSDAFTAANPNIKLSLEQQPGGTEGDNLNKTKLATGEMADVFLYNSGSLFQALNPDTNLTPLTDQPWVAELTPEMKSVVSTDAGTFGTPVGTTRAGGVIYNRKVYKDLGLKVPTSWAEFDANLKKIKADGKIDPIQQTYGDTWTSQLFVLGDFANVAAQDPNWAADYTANKAKYIDQPAIQSFKNQQQTFEAGYYNKDFASATYDKGIKAIATGTAAALPDAHGCSGCGQAELSGQHQRHRILPIARAGRGEHPDDPMAAECHVHPEDDRRRPTGGGEEVRGLGQLPGRLQDSAGAELGGRTLRDQLVHLAQ